MENQSFEDKLDSSKFGTELVKKLTEFAGSHLKESVRQNIAYEQYGTAYERKIKKIAHIYNSLNNTMKDIDLVVCFLKIENRKSIRQLFPAIEMQEQYYIYHLENYIIILITITDILGKLGNEVYNLSMDNDRCNVYTFKDKIKGIDSNCASILEKVIEHTKNIKSARHIKLHEGETSLNYFDKVVFWDEMAKMVKSTPDPLLDELTDNQINDEINRITLEVNNLISLIEEFLDHITPKLGQLIP